MKVYSCEETLKNLNNILDIDSGIRGLAYLEQISKNIYKFFEIEYIIIGKTIQPENQIAETIVALVNGEKIDNFRYELQNSPCENVFKSKEVCVYEDNVLQKFEKHSLITELEIEAYVGSPLMQNDDLFGLLVFLESTKIAYSDYYQSMISILSTRISVEIERYINDEMVISLQQRNLELTAKNQIDSLTGILNRHFFNLHVENLLKQGEMGTLLFLDLDDFKKINDSYGHQTGDKVLQYFTKAIQKSIRKHDIFARYGGEEFVLFLPDANKDIALSISQRIHNNLNQEPEKNIPKITVSIGAYTMQDNTKNLDILIKYADAALYEAKASGKNRTVFS